MTMTLDEAMQRVAACCYPHDLTSQAWDIVKANLSAQAKVRVTEAVPNDDADIRFAREHNLFIYEVDFGDEGKGRYVRLSDFNKVCESFAARLSQGAQSSGNSGELADVAECHRCGATSDAQAETMCIPDGDSCPGCEKPLADQWKAERAAVPDGLPNTQKVKRLKAVADGLRRIQEFESARYLDEYAGILTAAPQPPEGARVVDDAPSQRRLPKEAHSCVYPNGDGKCQECSDLAEVSIVRERIEQAIREHCSGGDLWLCSHLAAQHVWVLLAAPALTEKSSYQQRVAEWMQQAFIPSLYSNMTERGDRLLEEVLELLQSHGYDPARVATLVQYVFGRPAGEPAQEVGGVMVTLAGYCFIAGLDMHDAGEAELARITQPAVMAKIRAKQEAKNALHFDTPLPGAAPALTGKEGA